jgi:SMC interacting uncharacterized protein involved in chromosome segregation
MLPSPNSSDAPAIELHLPSDPHVPDIREMSTLIPSKSADKKDVETNGNFKEALENVIRAHEENEKKAAATLAKKVEDDAQVARAERKAMADKLEHVSDVVENLANLHQSWPNLVKEVGEHIADRFLERVDTLISELAGVKDTVTAHGLRITKLEGLTDRVATLERGLEEVKQQLSGLVGDGR